MRDLRIGPLDACSPPPSLVTHHRPRRRGARRARLRHEGSPAAWTAARPFETIRKWDAKDHPDQRHRHLRPDRRGAGAGSQGELRQYYPDRAACYDTIGVRTRREEQRLRKEVRSRCNLTRSVIDPDYPYRRPSPRRDGSRERQGLRCVGLGRLLPRHGARCEGPHSRGCGSDRRAHLRCLPGFPCSRLLDRR